MAQRNDESSQIPVAIPDWWRVDLKAALDAERGLAKKISDALGCDPSTITALHNGKTKISPLVVDVSRLAGIRSPVIPAQDPERMEAQEILSRLPAAVIPSILSLMRHHDEAEKEKLHARTGWPSEDDDEKK